MQNIKSQRKKNYSAKLRKQISHFSYSGAKSGCEFSLFSFLLFFFYFYFVSLFLLQLHILSTSLCIILIQIFECFRLLFFFPFFVVFMYGVPCMGTMLSDSNGLSEFTYKQQSRGRGSSMLTSIFYMYNVHVREERRKIKRR